MFKNKKRSAVDTALERRIKKFRSNPFFTTEPIQKYCEIIKEKAYGDCDDCSYINFNDGEQYVPSGVHQLTGEAVVMINRMSADPFWMQFSPGDIPDTEAFIGEIDDPVTGFPKTRAFWWCKLEETGEEHISELESLYTVAIANHSFDPHTDGADNTTITYAVITGFINNSMFEMDFYEPPSIKIIKEFISDISAALKANPGKRSIDTDKYGALNLTPKKEKELAACSYKLKRYDKDFKISTVKRIKENQLPLPQVSEILGIDDSLLSEWVREYDEKGEDNAFPGGGYKPHNIQKIDAPAQSKSAEAAVLDTNSDTISVKNTAANKKPVYDRNFKIAAVKLVNENKLSPPQVAKEINISYDRLGKWIREYEKHGESAFPGSGVYHDPNSWT